MGEITIAAPAENQSGKGHSITIGEPMYVDRVTLQPGLEAYSITATPASCVKVGVGALMTAKPDLVVSGINRGYNLGRVTYVSGTAGAAREAALMGIPAIAASLAVEQTDYAPAAEIVRQVVEMVRKNGLEPGVFLNVNVPPGARRRDQGHPAHAPERADRRRALRGAEDAVGPAVLLERVERADRRRRRHRRVGGRAWLRRRDAARGGRVRREDLRRLEDQRSAAVK